MLVMLSEESIDRGLKIGDRTEHAALQPAFHENGEEAFDGVEPGRRSGREMERPAGMALEPGADLGMLVGGTLSGINGDRNSLAHPADSHTRLPAGIPYRSPLSDQIH